MSGWLSMLGKTDLSYLKWPGILDGDLFEAIIASVVRVFYLALTLIVKIFGLFADLLNVAFYMFAGIDFTANGNGGTYDIQVNGKSENILDYFVLSETMAKSYFWLALVGLLLVVIFTLYRIIKQDYFDKSGPRSKGPIFRNVAISCISFLLVIPIFYIIIHTSSVLAVVVMDSLGMDASVLAGTKIFLLSWGDNGDVVQLVNSALNGYENGGKFVNAVTEISNMNQLNKETLFVSMADGKYVKHFPNMLKALGFSDTKGGWNGALSDGNYMLTIDSVSFPTSPFYWWIFIIAIISGVKALWTLILAMISRIFKLMALFLSAPAAISRYVLDDGAVFKSWMKDSIHEGLAVVVATMAFSIYLIVLSLIKDIDFTPAFKNALAEETTSSTELLSYNGLIMLAKDGDNLTAYEPEKTKNLLHELANAFMKICLISAASASIRDLDGILTKMISTGDKPSLEPRAAGAAFGGAVAKVGAGVGTVAKGAVGVAGSVAGSTAGIIRRIVAKNVAQSEGRAAATKNENENDKNNKQASGVTGPSGGSGPAGGGGPAGGEGHSVGGPGSKLKFYNEGNEQASAPTENGNIGDPENATGNDAGNEQASAPTENGNIEDPENATGSDEGNEQASAPEEGQETSNDEGSTTQKGDSSKAAVAPQVEKEKKNPIVSLDARIKKAQEMGGKVKNALAKSPLGIVAKTAGSLVKTNITQPLLKQVGLTGIGQGMVSEAVNGFKNARSSMIGTMTIDENGKPGAAYNKARKKEYSTTMKSLQRERAESARQVAAERVNDVEAKQTSLDKATYAEKTAMAELDKSMVESEKKELVANSANESVDKKIEENKRASRRPRATADEKKVYKATANELETFSFKNGESKLTQEMQKLGITDSMSFNAAKNRVGKEGSKELKELFNGANAESSFNETKVARKANIEANAAKEDLVTKEAAYDNAHDTRVKAENDLVGSFNAYSNAVNYAEMTYTQAYEEDANGNKLKKLNKKSKAGVSVKESMTQDRDHQGSRVNKARTRARKNTETSDKLNNNRVNTIMEQLESEKQTIDNTIAEDTKAKQVADDNIVKYQGKTDRAQKDKNAKVKHHEVDVNTKKSEELGKKIELNTTKSNYIGNAINMLKSAGDSGKNDEIAIQKEITKAQGYKQRMQVIDKYAGMSDSQISGLNASQKKEIITALGKGKNSKMDVMDFELMDPADIRTRMVNTYNTLDKKQTSCQNKVTKIADENDRKSQNLTNVISKGIGKDVATNANMNTAKNTTNNNVTNNNNGNTIINNNYYGNGGNLGENSNVSANIPQPSLNNVHLPPPPPPISGQSEEKISDMYRKLQEVSSRNETILKKVEKIDKNTGND